MLPPGTGVIIIARPIIRRLWAILIYVSQVLQAWCPTRSWNDVRSQPAGISGVGIGAHVSSGSRILPATDVGSLFSSPGPLVSIRARLVGFDPVAGVGPVDSSLDSPLTMRTRLANLDRVAGPVFARPERAKAATYGLGTGITSGKPLMATLPSLCRLRGGAPPCPLPAGQFIFYPHQSDLVSAHRIPFYYVFFATLPFQLGLVRPGRRSPSGRVPLSPTGRWRPARSGSPLQQDAHFACS